MILILNAFKMSQGHLNKLYMQLNITQMGSDGPWNG